VQGKPAFKTTTPAYLNPTVADTCLPAGQQAGERKAGLALLIKY
jgi:hypothetical protein